MPKNQNPINITGDILIVDDEVQNLRLLTQFLSEAGYQVLPAERPKLAIKSALAHPPNLILLDVRMPEIDGFEVCRRLKQEERTRDIPIIFVSALQDVQDRIRGFEVGGVDFISKPFQETEVLARVRTHMNLRNMQLNLEHLVAERTAELEAEIDERKQVEQKILEYQQRLKALASQLTIAEETERRRIAADLHDHVGQALALVRLQIASVRKLLSDPRQTDTLDEISDSLRQTVLETRDLIYDLSPPLLHEIGLSAAILEWLEEHVEKRYKIKTECVSSGPEEQLDKNLRAILFRNTRELVTNVIKHSHATQVKIRVLQDHNHVKIFIKDDGIGFDAGAASPSIKGESGFGLFSIKERMADMGGSLEIVSEPGHGTKAIMHVPLEKGKG
jgi:signal transduction histidine kinase